MSAIQSDRREKNAKNHVTFTRKFQCKSCPTAQSYFFQKNFTILGLLAKPFPTERKPSKYPTKERKGGKKRERSRENRKRKVKVEGTGKLSRKKTLEILLSAHARTSKAVIWHQEQKLA